MRSLLGFLVLAVTLIAALVFIAGPLLVRPLVVEAVRAALPSGDAPVDVAVDVDGFDLLGGHVREIRVSGSNLESDQADIGSLALTARGVGFTGREFESVEGTLRGVVVPLPDGPSIELETVELSGADDDVRAEVHLEPADAQALIARSLTDVGVTADRIALTDGGVALEILGQRVTVALAVSDGAIVLPSVMGVDEVPVVAPGPDAGWRVTGLTVRPNGLDLQASLDAGALLGE